MARQFELFVDLDGWIRRIRMCYWKQWGRARTKIRNLVRLGMPVKMAILHAITRKSYWRLSRTPATRIAMPNKWLQEQGLLSLKQLWFDHRAGVPGRRNFQPLSPIWTPVNR